MARIVVGFTVPCCRFAVSWLSGRLVLVCTPASSPVFVLRSSIWGSVLLVGPTWAVGCFQGWTLSDDGDDLRVGPTAHNGKVDCWFWVVQLGPSIYLLLPCVWVSADLLYAIVVIYFN